MKGRTFGSSIIILLCIAAIFCVSVMPAFANSAQTYFYGADAAGAIMPDKESPIVVEKELLTFDLNDLPSNYYETEADIKAYSARVTAEYTFYNPSDYTVTSKLLFPFGSAPNYHLPITFDDTEKYDITVNKEVIEKNIRHTFSNSNSFELSEELSLLSDGFADDAFYTPELTVTKYIFKVDGVNTERYSAATIGFDVTKGLKDSRIYFPEQSGAHTQWQSQAMRISTGVDKNGWELELYVFGTPLSAMPQWKVYKDGGVENRDVIEGTVTLVNTETTSFREFALENRDENSVVSESDWYNALVAELHEGTRGTEEYPVVYCDSFANGFEGSLMRWYEYEITVAPKERIVNAVTAPIYPSIDTGYNPSIYEYKYLLSPAKTWKSFGELEIVINTPYYIIESSAEGFRKTENGYTKTVEGLPDGELTFTLSESENPKWESRYALDDFDNPSTWVVWGLIVMILLVMIASLVGNLLFALAGAAVIIFIIVKNQKKKKK